MLSWSEVGFFYFTGGFLYILTSINNPSASLSILAWLNLFAFPYVFFSLYYQWKIAKQWCPLCLLIQVFLLTETVISLISYWLDPGFIDRSYSNIILLILSFSLPVIFWIAAKPGYLEVQYTKQYKKDLAQLAYNRDIFNALLVKQKNIIVPTEGLGISLGNPEATTTIIKVCNPFCGPCSRSHPAIEELLENNPEVKVQIIFSGIKDDASDDVNVVVSHLMALHAKGDDQLTKSALDEWYNNNKSKSNYEVFS